MLTSTGKADPEEGDLVDFHLLITRWGILASVGDGETIIPRPEKELSNFGRGPDLGETHSFLQTNLSCGEQSTLSISGCLCRVSAGHLSIDINSVF